MTQTIHLIDANNYFRRGFETGKPVSALVPLFNTPEPRFYTFDGKFAKRSRLALYPEYKAKRNVQAAVDSGFFDYLNTIYTDLLPYTSNAIIIKQDGFEADDIIAALVNHFAPAKNPILIHSNDADFLALTNELVTVTDRTKKLSHVPAHEIRLYKSLVGDSSDNISGIPKLGNSYWDKLTSTDKQQWEAVLTEQTDEFPLTAITEAKHKWITENMALLRTFYKIVGFVPVDLNTVMANAVISTYDPIKYHETMTKYMWM